MKLKYILLLVTLSIITGIIVYEIAFSQPGTESAAVNDSDTTIITTTQAKIDSLGAADWNENAYILLHNDIELKKVNSQTKNDLYASLELAYALAMSNSFNQWKTNKCSGRDISKLATAAKKQLGIVALKSLNENMAMYNKYIAVSKLENDVTDFINSEFTNESMDSLIDRIDLIYRYPSFSDCGTILARLDKIDERLYDFEEFYNDFTYIVTKGNKIGIESICEKGALYAFYKRQLENENYCK